MTAKKGERNDDNIQLESFMSWCTVHMAKQSGDFRVATKVFLFIFMNLLSQEEQLFLSLLHLVYKFARES